MCRIAFFDAKPYDQEFFDKANQKYLFEIKYLPTHLSSETAILAKNANIVCAFVNDKLCASVINTLHSYDIKLIALRCAGYNHVDLKEAFGKIKIVRVPKYSPHAVAEYTLSLILAKDRTTHRAYTRTRDNNFSLIGLMGFDMQGKIAGVIGAGQIGKVVARLLRGFDMKVLVYDITKDEAFAKETGCEYVNLDVLYANSDIITLHCPLTSDSSYMINHTSITKMKDGVMIINTGRGRLINTKDLLEGLKSRKIGSAGLDVYEEEGDYFFEDHSQSFIEDDTLARLQTFPNVLITSHQAFFTQEALENIASTTLQNIQEFIKQQPLTNEIIFRP